MECNAEGPSHHSSFPGRSKRYFAVPPLPLSVRKRYPLSGGGAERTGPAMKEILALFETLKVIRKASEDDFELRASADEKTWGVKMFSDDPQHPTYVIYAGPDAKESACDLADYELEDDDEDDDDDA